MGSSNSKKETLDCNTCPIPQDKKYEIEVNARKGKITLNKITKYKVNYNNNDYSFRFKYSINNILYFTNVQQLTYRNGATAGCPLNDVLPNSMLLIDIQDISRYEISEDNDNTYTAGKRKTKKNKHSWMNTTLNKRRKKK